MSVSYQTSFLTVCKARASLSNGARPNCRGTAEFRGVMKSRRKVTTKIPNSHRLFGKIMALFGTIRQYTPYSHADEEAMMAGLHHSLFRDDSDRFAVTIFVKFVRFVFVRKKRLFTPSNLNFFSS